MSARVYVIRLDGTDRFVEATGQGPAQNHVVKLEAEKVRKRIESCRAASAIAVANFVRGGGRIETAGESPPEPGAGVERAAELFAGEGENKGEEGGADGSDA